MPTVETKRFIVEYEPIRIGDLLYADDEFGMARNIMRRIISVKHQTGGYADPMELTVDEGAEVVEAMANGMPVPNGRSG